jgi:uncharacterized membrane protein AbrB (regulator of aidB expression)
MDQDQRNFMRSASAQAIFPIAGLLGGLVLGAVVGTSGMPDELAKVFTVVKWGVTGCFVGLTLAVLLLIGLRRKDVVSVRSIMILTLIAAGLCWFAVKVFFAVIGSYGS